MSEEKGKSPKKRGINRLKEMKLIVADTSAGKIIGKKGETVKKIQEVNDSEPYRAPLKSKVIYSDLSQICRLCLRRNFYGSEN